ncbi:ATP-binding cassette domain-containing protein [Streptomyces sp. SDr-06]|uniref:ABC transporter ATP-binding protein n=1 Tax=Streptomyces sp. SDr-06 TaxID=2267702 RepID=UPI000DEB65F0|nr:ATP-binding cassette domain-containing protein [Streptomyces sp. SDr-06]RCH64910.1 ATP-binding cassette domain-containing protein [Streptomyces sp. SDr-06]
MTARGPYPAQPGEGQHGPAHTLLPHLRFAGRPSHRDSARAQTATPVPAQHRPPTARTRETSVGPPRLLLSDISKSYGPIQVLDGVDLTVPPGALVGVAGENGTGKSTLLRIAVGQLAPDRGSIARSGVLGYCPQRIHLDDTLTVAQHLRLFQAAYRLADLDRAGELLDVLNFADSRHQRLGRLSGGTRQKLNLTLALMHTPDLLILDEPHQGFDWTTYERFWALVNQLRGDGCAIVVVSHLLHDQARFDTIHHLRAGRLTPLPQGEPR